MSLLVRGVIPTAAARHASRSAAAAGHDQRLVIET
jgi:hypothetical protein